ncbi:hypothetical protein MGYG_07732 [Nannizzia gypsea CBS 118893]|uniref:Defective in cullin neddylation protein n=1 Tax=Arthroderma gypseum (strain ATCC MYA-4604 / CBS 118893) TaxID=535722 RepID=E4V400_ARTGP|nr:hypothetical protein MGYG_07732 [Nannizzia gypsea CBS 118893]EFR04724.1 hypothetical protein MGYG_07732 [Nannizzia gypsea CBS 118893]
MSPCCKQLADFTSLFSCCRTYTNIMSGGELSEVPYLPINHIALPIFTIIYITTLLSKRTIGRSAGENRRSEQDIRQVSSPDEIGINGAMKYFGDLQVRCDTIQKQAAYADGLRKLLQDDPNYFRRVYRYTFLLCRMQGQRNVNIELAVEQWQLFFTSENGGVAWETKSVPWLKWWIEFIETKHKRPINKDLWEQTEVLMRKTMEDESMDWWSSDAAWPGAIDDFVAFVKEKQG